MARRSKLGSQILTLLLISDPLLDLTPGFWSLGLFLKVSRIHFWFSFSLLFIQVVTKWTDIPADDQHIPGTSASFPVFQGHSLISPNFDSFDDFGKRQKKSNNPGFYGRSDIIFGKIRKQQVYWEDDRSVWIWDGDSSDKHDSTIDDGCDDLYNTHASGWRGS